MMDDTRSSSPNGSDGDVEAEFDATSQQAQQVVGGTAPEATEPMQADVVNSLGQVLVGAIGSLSGGQIEPPPIPEVADAVPSVPPELWAGVVTLGGFLDQAVQQGLKEAQAHAGWDLETLGTTNAGLSELTVLVDNVGRDKALAQAMRKPVQGPPAGEGEAAPSQPPEPKNDSKARELLGGG